MQRLVAITFQNAKFSFFTPPYYKGLRCKSNKK